MTSDEIYRTQQFGQRTGFGKRPALLVVDFVNGFADPQLLGGGNIRDAIAATAPLLAFSASGSFRSFSPASFTPRTAPTPDSGARRRLACGSSRKAQTRAKSSASWRREQASSWSARLRRRPFSERISGAS